MIDVFQYLMKLHYSQTITVCELRPAFAGLFIFPGLSLKCHHHSAAQIKGCTIVILSQKITGVNRTLCPNATNVRIYVHIKDRP